MTREFVLKHLSVVFIFFALAAHAAFAQTTAFNFQGKLNDGANPANGNVEMQFKLFDSLAGGTQTSATLARPNVAVINGIFSTPLDFGAAAFDGSNRFVEIGVRPAGSSAAFTILNPRQPIFAAPYAIQTKNAAQLGGIDASQYVTTATVGGSFIKNATTQQASANFNISGSGFFGGNVGIGTTAPTTRLQVQTNGYGMTQTNGAVTVGTFVSPTGGWYGTATNHPLFFFTNDSQPQMTLSTAGNFGIGTTDPTARLYVISPVSGTTAIYGESASGRGVWGKSTGSRGVYGESSSLEGVYGISNSGAGIAGRSTSNSGVYGESNAASLTAGGVYGRGTGSGSIGVIGESNVNNAVGVYGSSTSSTGFGMYAKNTSGGRAIYADGNVDVNGTTKTNILQITGGSDLAEHFEFTETVQPGMVVAIDPLKTGKLIIARGVYNRRVAGIISGANNLAAGMTLPDLKQTKNSLPVALSGRVWVYCDATRNPIQAGDLLTTSATPGHAMKVVNQSRAQGAIIGKAMSELKSGKGLVLVLVSLQ